MTKRGWKLKTKVYLETFGCQMNVADTERAQTRLRSSGYELTDSAEEAEVVLFNTCSVRARAAQKVLTRVGEVLTKRAVKKPLIGLLGCVAQLEGESLFDQSPAINLVVGTRATDRLPELIRRSQDGERHVIDLGEREAGASWDVATVERRSPYIAFVPIIEGCNKFCSYCIVPYSRGREQSRAATDIVSEVKALQREGYREAHLIGQNVNSYRPKTTLGLEGFDGATPFSRLLRAVAATGLERIKFTTSFPRDFHLDIIRALDEHENLCNWVHLPVQSGSDAILRAMRRGHKSIDYLRRVEAIKTARRRIALTSDIIVGFPGETERDFQDTMRLVEQCQYDGLYIFKYSARKGTPSANLPDSISKEEKTERFLALERLQQEIQSRVYGDYVGREVCVLVEGESAKSASDMTGHSACQKVLNFPAEMNCRGQLVKVRVTAAKLNSLYGQRV